MAKSQASKAKAALAAAAKSGELVAIDPVEGMFLDNVPHVPHLVPADVAEQLVATGAFSLADESRAAEIADEVMERMAAVVADQSAPQEAEGAEPADEAPQEPSSTDEPQPTQ